MLARLAAVAAVVALASCAGLEPAGRNADRSPAPQRPPVAAPQPHAAPPAVVTRAPAPQVTPAQPPAPVVVQQAPPPVATSAPSVVARAPVQQVAPPPVAAPNVTVATPPPARPTRQVAQDGDIVVPGQVQTQVQPPQGDPRSNEERGADIRSWDQCVTQVQAAFEGDPMRPQLDTPEDYCSRTLGMRDRTAVPTSRRRDRR